MNESPIVLACEDVTLGYEHKPLLEHLTLTVRAGDEVLLELPLEAEQAVDKLTENRQKVKFDWTAPAGGGEKKTDINAAMNDLIRGAMK